MTNGPSALDVIVPCYNPLPGWETVLSNAFQAFTATCGTNNVRMILVNDGSTMNVTEAGIDKLRAAIPNFHYVSYATNMGKGEALRQGVQAATAPLMLFTDIDFPYTIQSMVAVHEALQNGADVALGYRNTAYYDKVPWFRKQLSKFLRWMLKRLLRLAITDTQCGLKGFNQHGRERFLQTTINRFLFDLEFVMLTSRQASMEVRPVQVALRDDVTFSKVNGSILLREAMNFLGLLLKPRKQ